MKKGVLQQVGSPEELYSQPANLFVGGFIGSPAMNLVEAELSFDGADAFVGFGGLRLGVPAEVLAERPALAGYRDRKLILGIRPEHMDDAALVARSDPSSRLRVNVDLREGMGSDVYVHFSIDAPPVFTEDTRELASDIDEKALAELKQQATERRSPWIARAGPETEARVGAPIEIHVDTRKLYFFDPATGDSIRGRETVAPTGVGAGLTT
jgi:multiple sugar transport system ATP-binding protein